VYVADDVRLERQVAVKLLRPEPDEEGFARFATEARVLGGLSHPGLVTVYDVNLQADRPYMVMRLVDGGPLSTHAGHEDLEPVAVAQLGAQLADVLAYVHERGVVHGDLDAANVLIDAQGTGHLTGFGADRGLGRPSGDIYALGMTLAEHLPFDLGPEWRMVLSIMTDHDPDARPDAARCGELLRNVASGVTNEFPLPDLAAEPEAAEPAAAGNSARTKRKRPAYTGLAGIGLAATALAVAVATTLNSGTEREPAGERQQNPPPAEQQQPDDTGANPPAQTYPRGTTPEQARKEPPKRSEPPGSTTTTPPRTTSPPPDDGYDDDNGGPGNGNGNGNGRDDDRARGGLIGIIIGLG
jgi:serine/threonine protein kinase